MATLTKSEEFFQALAEEVHGLCPYCDRSRHHRLGEFHKSSSYWQKVICTVCGNTEWRSRGWVNARRDGR